jgi:hypothetical protein
VIEKEGYDVRETKRGRRNRWTIEREREREREIKDKIERAIEDQKIKR